MAEPTSTEIAETPVQAAVAVSESHSIHEASPVDAPVDANFVMRCADCDTPITGKYCSACGQETLIETPTVRHFLHEFADQYVALEGKMGRTLRVLMTRPGQLTLDYVEGRRQRYVRPLKLYLTISVVFFTLLGVLPDSLNPISRPPGHDADPAVKINVDTDGAKDDEGADKPGIVISTDKGKPVAVAPPAAPPEAGPVSGTGKADSSSDKGAEKDHDDEEPAPGSFGAKLKTQAETFSKLSRDDQNRVLRKKLSDDAPYAMFFLLPFFAFLLKIFYRKQNLRYGVHLLFSLHVHCFLFILLTVGFLPMPNILRELLQLGAASYLFVALRRVYGGTIKRTLWRMVWLFLYYMLALSVSAVSGILTTLFGGDWT